MWPPHDRRGACAAWLLVACVVGVAGCARFLEPPLSGDAERDAAVADGVGDGAAVDVRHEAGDGAGDGLGDTGGEGLAAPDGAGERDGAPADSAAEGGHDLPAADAPPPEQGVDLSSDLGSGDGGASGFCSPAGWCWDNPLPQGNALNGIWGSGATDVHAVGFNGMFSRYDGTSWQGDTSVTRYTMYAVHGSSATDVVAAGGALRFHFDGNGWQEILPAAPNVLYAVWVGPFAAYAVGAAGTFLKRTAAKAWEALDSGTLATLYAVWGNGPTQAVAVGLSGLVLSYDGTSFDEVHPVGDTLRGLWGSGPTLFAVGESGAALRYDGAWHVDNSGTGARLDAVWGASPTDVHAVGAAGTVVHYDGSAWSVVPTLMTDALYAVWGSGPSDIHAVGLAGQMIHYDGNGWTSTRSGHTDQLNAGWVTETAQAYAAGDDGLFLRRHSGGWTSVPCGTAQTFHAIWGRSATEVYIAGDGGTLRRFSVGACAPVSSGSSQSLRGLWGNSSELIAVGTLGRAVHCRPSCSEHDTTVGTTLHAVWVTADGSAVAVGESGAFARYDGSLWTAGGGPATSVRLEGIWGVGPSDLVVAAQGGSVYRSDGSGWNLRNASSYSLHAVWGRSATEIYAVGDIGTIVRYDGTSWAKMESSCGATLRGVHGGAGGELFVVGSQGAILRRP